MSLRFFLGDFFLLDLNSKSYIVYVFCLDSETDLSQICKG